VQAADVFDEDRGGAKCGPFGSALKKNEYVKLGIPVWTMENVQANKFAADDCLFITEKKFKDLAAYGIRSGDILISRAGTVGRMAVVETSHERSIMHSNLIRLALDQSKIIPQFFVVLMTFFGERVARLKTGQEDAYTFMNTGTLEALPIPLPSMREQEHFMSILDTRLKLKQAGDQAFREASHLFKTLLHRAFN
jgi:type I restriction enzyme, S subunit